MDANDVVGVNQLLINVLLYVFLPIWGIAGFLDWVCHRRTHIEQNSGLMESSLHSLMGIQIAIPIALCLLYQINVTVLLVCIFAWLAHEVIAHIDVWYASPRRDISIWEMHAHSYLATLPFFMLTLIFVLNWPMVKNLVTLNWQGHLALEPLRQAHGFDGYVFHYTFFMAIICVFPYAEENIRCAIYFYRSRIKISR
ncbi:diguanylate cyclase [Marinibactrum halimedae]|uniref:Diguanylate cyclase n=2 Tax=Marinibactrum halimedae TaxID=1444977 RepID=A0AA37WKN9_9GAMM|nr:diguanylate cyclase [Marinibactrum halimedae]MCD9457827.1 diguanylate cyclase [Marinibactrum halimedae]GLS24799.1 hypothetical protein GCM10007877_05130 [Marinibactrum halimedae]